MNNAPRFIQREDLCQPKDSTRKEAPLGPSELEKSPRRRNNDGAGFGLLHGQLTDFELTGARLKWRRAQRATNARGASRAVRG